MSDHHANPPGRRARSRLRRFFLRHVPITLATVFVLLVLAIVGAYFYASSATFENNVRRRLAASLGRLTGGQVEIASFHWRLLSLQADAGGVVIHGREARGEAPYAEIGHLRVEVSVLGFLSPRILLHSLEIDRPEIHWIVYPDGSTNQPEPRRKRKPGEPMIDRIFDLQAGRIVVENGVFEYDNRAARFDFQNRYIPLNFKASNASLRMSYVPALAAAQQSYRIELGATDLDLRRGTEPKADAPVHGRMDATLDLMRSAATLRQLRLAARSSDGTTHTLEINGTLADFSHPSWQMKTSGELDMRLLEALTGYPFAPEGIAHLNLAANGNPQVFRLNGRVHVDDGAYIGTGVVARNVTLDAVVAADPYELRISDIVARFRQGGQMDGIVDLKNWLPISKNAPHLEPAALRYTRTATGLTTIQPANDTIPVDGNVTAQLRNVALDTILDMVSQQPFQRLGIGALLNGPATAKWTKGDANTVAVSTQLAMSPSGAGSSTTGEAPASGTIDATYTQHNGAVAVHTLELQLPGSSLLASGQLGAYPMTSPTSLAVDFHSHNLAEFDTVLRALGLDRGNRKGVAALPAKLAGQADFHGTWTGSLMQPRIAGDAKAAQLAIEMPTPQPGQPVQQRFINFDSAVASGSYSETRIAIAHANLQHGAAHIALSGTLDAAMQPSQVTQKKQTVEPVYDRDSVIHAKIQAANVTVDDLQPFFASRLPATGSLDAQLEAHGPLGATSGAGFVELKNGSLYGQPIPEARARGTFENRTLKLASIDLSIGGGTISGAGSFDISARRFDASAHGSGMQLAHIEWLRSNDTGIAGRLGLTLTGSGSLDDPRLDGHVTVNGLTIGSEALGSLDITAHTSGGALHYDGRTLLAGAELNLHGETALHGDYITDNHMEFSRFDVGALLKMAQVPGLSGESALAGTITVSGPLKQPDKLRGEASLNTLAVTLDGVHLEGQGGAHATLADGRIHLDPMHVTGEDTDVRAEGGLSIRGAHKFDVAAHGSVNLKLAETLDPDLTASGTTTFEVEAHGTMQNPGLRGTVQFQNGAIALEDLPNGLSQLHGTLEFNQNRLEVRQLTAMTGGGLLSLGGSLTYQHGLYADLTVTGKGVRIRYPQGVSSLADANLRLQGSENNLLLSGNVLITRFATSPDLDLEALAEQANSSVQTVALPNSPSNHVRLDVHLMSSPQLNFQNAFAKLAGDVDLHLRGTLASPSVLGQVSVTEGSAVIAGTRYELQRGDISFTNPVRIEPVIDLTATAHVQDYDITLGLHGSPQRPIVTYRSDPPLAESDVLSLLALGHTQDQERLYTQQQEQELSNPSTDALLGGALNATVSSRVQKLFGAGSVKVDPDYLGAFGNATSRITVQEQVGRDLTLTYATDVNTTGQQLLQAEVAINRHISLVVARDEAGVFSMVLKATRRYK